jgi:putative hemolysin
MSAEWLAAAIALLFSAIFSGVEIVFLSTHKLELELLSHEGSVAGKIMHFFSRRPALFFCTTLLGNILSLIGLVYFTLGALFPNDAGGETGNLIAVLATIIIATLLIILVAYLIPKCWVAIHPARAMTWLILPFTLCFAALVPLSYLVLSLFQFIARTILRIDYPENRPLFRVGQFQQPPPEKTRAVVDELEEEMANNLLEFKAVKVRDCMIPRTEITAIEANESIERLRHAFVESGFSKIIIFRKTIDDIIGYCHSSALFKKPASIQEILVPIITAPETTPANELMMRFIHEKKNLAVVMDEFGGTSGIVSAEDIIEEIFGAVDNEPDEEDDLVEQQLDAQTFLFNARLEIDYLNESYALQLPTGDYETLAGLILTHTENMPSPGEVIHLAPYKFLIQSAYSNRIGIVKITVENPENEGFSPSGDPA